MIVPNPVMRDVGAVGTPTSGAAAASSSFAAWPAMRQASKHLWSADMHLIQIDVLSIGAAQMTLLLPFDLNAESLLQLSVRVGQVGHARHAF